ncbi:hypothetical protein ACJJH9_00035 (plasmid) [Microbulbifer sp. DLAB2-AF]|uniref:hypothetical protein n=1 Tax=Microbulbifer sp. DLAB2-AF TaxID=3243395 RepID=UPI00403A6681
MNRVFAIFLVIFFFDAYATECPETENGFDPKIHFEYSGEVFLGYISEGSYDLKGWEHATSSGPMYVPTHDLTFEVLHSFKGESGGTLKLKATDQGFHDGWRIGDLYIIFLGRSSIGVCTKVTPLYAEYFNEFAPLEELEFMLERADVTQSTKTDIEFLLTTSTRKP